jgi:hypothetical protein
MYDVGAFDMHQNLIGLSNYSDPERLERNKIDRSEIPPNPEVG